MKVGINLLTLDKLEYTKECIRTLEKYTPKDLFKLCIVDQGSLQDTLDYLKTLPYDILYNPYNIGIPKARNEAQRFLTSNYSLDFLCCIHNDMFFTPNWLEIMIEEISHFPKCMMLGCAAVHDVLVLQKSDEEREKISFALRENKTERGNLDPRLIRLEAIRDIGEWDERFSPHDSEDVDYNYRVEKAGFQYLGTNKVLIFHYFSLTRLQLPHFRQDIKKCIAKFHEKYPDVDHSLYNQTNRVNIVIDGTPYLRNGV
jgi:GT2 family glycosyltransferase